MENTLGVAWTKRDEVLLWGSRCLLWMFVFEAISGSKEDFIRPKMGANKRGGGELFFSCEYEDAVDQQGPFNAF